MKPSQLRQLLLRTIPAGRPVFISGPPGVGKTQIPTQVTAELGYHFVVSHPVLDEPTDVKGLPWVGEDRKSATFLPVGIVDEILGATEPTVWLLDDLPTAPGATQAAYMQFFLQRRINQHRLPDCVTIIAAGNRRGDRAAASPIIEPLKSRFATIVELEADLDDTIEWALSTGKYVPEVIAFLRVRPDLLCDFKPTGDMTNSPVPRTWENASSLFELDLPQEILAEALQGAVGAGATTEFMGFLDLYRTLPAIDEVLKAPNDAPIPDHPPALYALVTGIAARVDETTFASAAWYAQRLFDNRFGEFAALLLLDATRRNADLLQHPAFVRLAAGDIGAMFL